jgi:tetratricopeptide (TPR) repeat protein
VSASVDEIIGEATKLEKEYEWLQASQLYEQALSMVDGEDYFRKGETQEKKGHSLHRAAFQAKNRKEFLNRMSRAVEVYEDAHGSYERMADEKKEAWIFRTKALTKYLGFWIASDPSEKVALLDECLELERKALTSFSNMGEMLEYGRTYNKFSLVFWHRCHRSTLEERFTQAEKKIWEDGIRWGEKAVAALSEPDDLYEITKTYFTLCTCQCYYFSNYFPEPERTRARTRALRKAFEFSERSSDDHIIGLSNLWLGYHSSGEVAMRQFEKALECGEKTGDIFLKGLGNNFLAYRTWWSYVIPTDDPGKKREYADKAMEFYDMGLKYCATMSFYGYEAGPAMPHGGYIDYYILMGELETDPEKKIEYLDRAVEVGGKALKKAEKSGYRVGYTIHTLSKALTARAGIETDQDEKRSLLLQAMIISEKHVTSIKRISDQWNKGVPIHIFSRLKAELAKIEPELDKKRILFEEALLESEECLRLCSMGALSAEADQDTDRVTGLGRFARLHGYQNDHATILLYLYELTNETDYLRKAIKTWRNAIESASKLELLSRIAESYWRIAKAQDVLGEHLEAAENFRLASENYMKAVEKIPQLKEFYMDYSKYMQAWSEIEKAGHHHTEKHYGEAKKHYEKAAELHKVTERWNYLSPNYLAWTKVEEAEDLSRREQTQEARDSFQQAARLFTEAKELISFKLKTIETMEEKRIAGDLVKASDFRREYCLGRVALEDARVLDRQGNHSASSKRYGEAVETFQRVMDSLERESDQKELQPIINLCKAWEKMMMAEAHMSPSLYDEAAGLFIEARDNASDQTTRLLAQAHSSFCKALEAGTRFELTRETELFSEAKRHIEASTSYYLRAGQQTMSDYAGATSRFLDAYLYTYNAQTEADPLKKAQFYKMAERLLQSSAGAYLKAKHPEKSDEIRRILGRVKEEREIAVSLSEVLHTPSLVSTTASFSTPTPTHERAVGLERFESADIQANLITRSREVGVGEDLDLEIELVNAGKAPAQLVKVEDIVIEGFELKSYPEICRVEDSYLDMKGRTLSPLKTQELKLVLKPLTKGSFELKPRILYLDEAGKYKSHEPDPVSITVQELGIRGWLRGPTR